ncbi:MAG: tRNA lysidine(34) synthetase TilS [Candidatus Firestonebacteria bacterium]
MLKKVIETINKYSMLNNGDKVIVGVSGGPDSVALLLILNKIRKYYNLSLHIVHVNYHLRGLKSDGDERYVGNLARKLKIPITVEQINTKEVIGKKSIQKFAREIRYKVFEKAANEIKANKIALGHNLDDNVETIIMRFIRGSGLTGLSGIPYVRPCLKGRVRIIRPLMNCFRKEIDNYLKKLKVNPRLDSSNLKPVYLRNKIRLELIPLIEKEYNPKFKENLFRLSEILNYEDKFLSLEAFNLYKKLVKKTEYGLKIKIKALTKFHPAIILRILREILKDIKGDLLGLEYKHIESIINIISNKVKRVELPGEIIVEKHINNLVFRKKVKRYVINSVLKINKSIKINNLVFFCRIIYNMSKFKKLNNAYLDLDKISLPIIIRSRKPGDRFIPFGMKGAKKLQDFFVDEKISEYKRDGIPVFVDSKNRILWVAGLRIDNRFKVTSNTKRILHIKRKISGRCP